MLRHPLSAVGFTHASTVMPVVRSSAGESGIDTESLTPSKESARPNFPFAVRVAPLIVPIWWKGDASMVVVPDVSSKPNAATRPVTDATGATPETSTDGLLVRPAVL